MVGVGDSQTMIAAFLVFISFTGALCAYVIVCVCACVIECYMLMPSPLFNHCHLEA